MNSATPATRASRPLWWLALFMLCGTGQAAVAEDGYDLWMHYRPLPVAQREVVRRSVTAIVAAGRSPTLDIAQAELVRGLGGLLGRAPPRPCEEPRRLLKVIRS